MRCVRERTIFMQWNKLIDAFWGLPKTIYFNFKYLPIKQAIKLPIFLSHHVRLWEMEGIVEIHSPRISMGMITIGFENVGIFDSRYSRTIWKNQGGVIFEGRAGIGHGSRLSINSGGTLIFGDGFKITAESQIICSKYIRFGKDVLISWQCLFMDTDFHHIIINGKRNLDRNILIGDHVWIGCRCTILKGAEIRDNCVVAANSNVIHSLIIPNALIAGNPARVIKSEIEWEI